MSFVMGDIVAKALPVEERNKFDLVQLLQSGGVVVIVGGRSTNFTEEMRRDPRLEFWDSTDPKAHSRDLPSNARALLFTKFISHEWDGRLRRQARKRGIYCKPGIHETGELRKELQRVVDHALPKAPVVADEPMFVLDRLLAAAAVPPSPVARPVTEAPSPQQGVQPVTQKRGRGVSDFVATNVNLHASDRRAEAERLLTLMKAKGIKSTVGSVMESMRLRARQAGSPLWKRPTNVPSAAGNGKVTEPTPPVRRSVDIEPILDPEPILMAAAPPPPAVAELQQVRTELKQARTTMSPHADALVQTLAEAERIIADMIAAANLLGELMPRVKAEIAVFRDKQRRAAEIFLD